MKMEEKRAQTPRTVALATADERVVRREGNQVIEDDCLLAWRLSEDTDGRGNTEHRKARN